MTSWLKSLILPPTIYEAAGFEKPNNCQGESLYPLLCGKPSFFQKKKKEVYYCNLHFLGIRTDKLKLILDLGSGETKLFDLVKDPSEKDNLIQEYSTEVVKSLIDKVRSFQEETEKLRRKLNISQVKLLEGIPTHQLAFDDYTLLLASFSQDDFYYKKRGSVKKAKLEAPELQLVEGKYGQGLLLKADKKISFPLKTPLLDQAGSLELWLKLNKAKSQNQRVLKLYFEGKDSSLAIEATALWSWMENGEIGISFKVNRVTGRGSENELSFAKKILWNGWHHILLAWEENEVFLVIDGHPSSRRKVLAGDLFKQATTDTISISGQNCVVDDLRISNALRLFRPSGHKKVKIGPKVLEKLKALGYIK